MDAPSELLTARSIRTTMMAYLRGVLVSALVIPLWGCLVIISTGPTPIRQSNVLVIVRTDRSGEPVAGAGVRIQSGSSPGDLARGATDGDGRFVSAITPGDDPLRIVVDVPTGFTAPAMKSGSVEVMLPSGSDQVTIVLSRAR